MTVKNGDIIRISFTGRIDNGPVFDTTDEGVARQNDIFDERRAYGPMAVVVGSGTLVQGLDEALLGKAEGHRGAVKVPPEAGYGFRSIELVDTIPAKKFPERPEPGTWVEYRGRAGIVESVSGGRVRVDFNDPLAGKALVYDYAVEEILGGREEKTEAIVHGYVGQDAKYSVDGDSIAIDVPGDYGLSEEWAQVKLLVGRLLTGAIGYRRVTYRETLDASDFADESVE